MSLHNTRPHSCIRTLFFFLQILYFALLIVTISRVPSALNIVFHLHLFELTFKAAIISIIIIIINYLALKFTNKECVHECVYLCRVCVRVCMHASRETKRKEGILLLSPTCINQPCNSLFCRCNRNGHT